MYCLFLLLSVFIVMHVLNKSKFKLSNHEGPSNLQNRRNRRKDKIKKEFYFTIYYLFYFTINKLNCIRFSSKK